MKKRKASEILAENLKELMDCHASLDSQSKLADKSGLGQSTIGRILRAETDSSIDTVQKLAACFHMDASSILKEKQHRVADGQGDYSVAAPKKIPLFNNARDALGYVSVGAALEKRKPAGWIRIPTPVSDLALGFNVKTNSMLADTIDCLPPGYIAVVEPEQDLRTGDIVLVLPGGFDSSEATFRRYVKEGDDEYLQATNPSFKTIDATPTTLVIGLVVYAFKHFTEAAEG